MNRCHLGVCALVVGLATAAAVASPLIAQQRVVADGRSDKANGKVLSRPVTIALDHVPLQDALRAIAANAKVTIQFQAQDVRGKAKRVTLDVKETPLGAVLEQILAGTNLQVVPFAEAGVTIVPANGDVLNAGGIVGVVTNAKTGQPMRGAMVTLDDSVRVERTNESGQYRFANVGAGSHRISVRAIGFARQTRLVTVDDDGFATANFLLEGSVNTLDQVVVTATGAQQYRTLGHVVTQLNVDSLVREAPITSVSELLTARVPGLQVTGVNGGSVGGEVALRIRGTTTTFLDPQPIVIVDGVRYKNTNTIDGTEDRRPFNAEQRSPLNDLNVNDIETVEVVKGPSASTLYGPDAANGVIVITTKRGTPGKASWHVYAYPDLSTQSVGQNGGRFDYPAYYGWGHVPNTTQIYAGQCTRDAQIAQECILDSLVVAPNPVNNPTLSVVAKDRPQWHSGVSVNGGASALSYFFSGNWDSQTGALRLSPVAEQILENRLGVEALSAAVKSPNTQQTVSLHTSMSAALSATSTVAFVGNYTQATQRAIRPDVLITAGTTRPLDPGQTLTDSTLFLTRLTNANAFLQTTQMDVGRLTAALNGTFQLRPWLTSNASVGTDLDNTTDRGQVMAGVLSPSNTGQASEYRRDNTYRNAHVGLVGTAHVEPWSFRTSVGMDYSYSHLDGLNTQGVGLAPGSSDISTASSQSVGRAWTESAQLGGYGEEILGLRDRLFLTGSLRIDGSTSFGDAYAPKPFPKVGLSWVVSDEPLFRPIKMHGIDELRLRYSYGAASRYPTSAMKWGSIRVNNATVEDGTSAEFQRFVGANPDLKPERSRESEYGADITVASNTQIGLTWYNRRTDDGLQVIDGPQGMLPGWANVGDLSAHGFELTATTQLFTSHLAALTLNFSYAYQTNKVLSLGAATSYMSEMGSYVVGYPLGAVFSTKTTGYVDSAGGGPDGWISDPSEVISSPEMYLGTNFAPRTYTVTPALTLMGGALSVSALFDRQSGGVSYGTFGTCSDYLHCPATFLKSTPLLEQAISLNQNNGDWVQSSDFTRWRELSVTATLPTAWRRALHLSRASTSIQIRNLALWTPSLAPDPESVPGLGTTGAYQYGLGRGTSGIPFPRTWTMRFDIVP